MASLQGLGMGSSCTSHTCTRTAIHSFHGQRVPIYSTPCHSNATWSCATPQQPLSAGPPLGPAYTSLHARPMPRLNVVCMAHPRRVAKVSSQVQREIGKMFIEDEVMVRAITPERAGGARELSALVSVTDVYVSNDLQYVKVYVSIYSDERGKQKAMANLKRLEPYVRREMGQRVPLRLTPVYKFEYDDSQEELDLMVRVLGQDDIDRLSKELAAESQAGSGVQSSFGTSAVAAGPSASSQQQQATGDGTGDEEDEGFFAADELQEEEDEYEEDPEELLAWQRSEDYATRAYQRMPGPFDAYFGDYDGADQSGSQVRRVSGSRPTR